MLISIIIVNWKSKDYVRQCLKTLPAACGRYDFQTIVVDGGSFDGCGEMIAAEFPEVEFVQSPENVGFGRSNNLGAEFAKGEILALVNPDTELDPGCLETLADQLQVLPAPGILGSRLRNPDGSLQTSCVQALPTPLNQALGSEFLLKRFPRSRLWKSHQAFSSKNPSAVEAVGGALMLLETQLFRKVGGFTESFFMYAEDMDLNFKCARAGRQSYHVPAAGAVHYGGGSSSTQPSQFSILQKCVALHHYMAINHGPWTAARYRLAMFSSSLVRFLCLVPPWALGGTGRREQSRNSMRKWRWILEWSILPGAAGGQNPTP